MDAAETAKSESWWCIVWIALSTFAPSPALSGTLCVSSGPGGPLTSVNLDALSIQGVAGITVTGNSVSIGVNVGRVPTSICDGASAISGRLSPWDVTVQQGIMIAGADGIQLGVGNGVTPSGSITVQAGATVTAQTYGIASGGTVALVNAGIIAATDLSGANSPIAVNLNQGSVTNLPGGVITSVGPTAVSGTLTAFTNAGTISATGGPGNAAVRIGVRNGITVVNSGTISGANGTALAISAGSGGSFTLINSGTVAGGSPAFGFIPTSPALQLGGDIVPSGGATTVVNAGTISTTADVAIQFAAGRNTLILQPGSTIVGQVIGGSGQNTAFVDGATVSGRTGFVNFDVVNRTGVVAPGTSGNPGTLSITGGSYTQQGGGTLAITVTPAAVSKLNVTGTASLAGTLALQAAPGSYRIGGRYTVVSAAGGISGTFGQITGASISPILTLVPSYLPNQVDLTVNASTTGTDATYAGLAGNGSQRSIGAALDAISRNPAPGFLPVLAAITALPTTGQIQNALDQIGSGAQSSAGAGSAAVSGGMAMASAVGEQVFGSHGAPTGGATLAQAPRSTRVQLASLDPVAALAAAPDAPTAAVPTPWSAWLSGYGIFGAVGGNANASGYSYAGAGTVVGADYRISTAWLAGMLAGYAGTSSGVSGLATKGTVETTSVGLYGSWTGLERLYVDGMVAYGYSDNSLTRTIAFPGFAAVTARARSHGNQFMSSLETGYRLGNGEAVTVTPFLGLQTSVLDQSTFTESGAGALNLTVNGQSIASIRSQIGGRASRDVVMGESAIVNLSMKVGWAHDLSDNGRTATASFAGTPGSTFSVQGAARGRDSALVGAGIATDIGTTGSVYLRYDGDLNEHDAAHAVIGGLRLAW